MTEQVENTNLCLNCQSELHGPFCGQCGQAQSARLVPLEEWLSDFFGTFFKLDSKLLKTLKRVFFQPGQATLDFANGRRVPFSGPAKVYIIVSAISIAAMTLQGAFSHQMEVPGVGADADFEKRVQFLFPFVNLLSPFATVAILAVIQRKQFIQLHLAFSLHLWTFLIAAATPLIYIPAASLWFLIGFVLYSGLSVGYLYLSHQRVYSISFLKRMLACAVILISLPITVLVFTGLLFALASILP